MTRAGAVVRTTALRTDNDRVFMMLAVHWQFSTSQHLNASSDRAWT